MYSAAIYNYFNNSRYTRKTKYRKRRIPIPKPVKAKRMNTCKTCGRGFLRAPSRNETDMAIVKQPGNIVYDKVLLIWKYAKNFLSKAVRRQDPQKCSFKIIAHKSYKKRSLQKEILTTSASVLQQLYCPICEQQFKVEKNKCLHVDEQNTNDKVLQEIKPKSKKKDKRKVRKSKKEIVLLHHSSSLTETSDTTQTHEYLRGKKRHIRLCTRSSRSSFQKKRPKYNSGSKVKNLRALKKPPIKKKTDNKKNGPKKPVAPKRKLNTNKNKKQSFFRENRKKTTRFASWQYIQHALNSVTDDNPSSQSNEDKTPVYLTFEEYCLILEAIDTPGNTAERNSDEDSSTNVGNPPETENTGSTSRIENVGTNTEVAVANTEDASTNTDILWESEEVATNTEKIIDNTEELTNKTVLASISELNEETEDINEELNENSERLSETTETLDAVNDLVTEAIEDFEANMTEPSSDSTISIEINKANDNAVTNSSKSEKPPSEDNSESPDTNEQPTEKCATNQPANLDSNIALRRNVVPNNSFVDINEISQSPITVDPNRLCEEIGKLETSDGTEQTQKH